jgi:hypothetical protein
MRPDIPRIRTHVLPHAKTYIIKESEMGRVLAYSRFRRAHHKVNKKKTASTIDATLLASVLNPHAIRQAPMKEEPR